MDWQKKNRKDEAVIYKLQEKRVLVIIVYASPRRLN